MPPKPSSPRDAERIISGFSELVAMAVTHPLWPLREPLNVSGSPMM